MQGIKPQEMKKAIGVAGEPVVNVRLEIGHKCSSAAGR
jgi:hypothetical protein